MGTSTSGSSRRPHASAPYIDTVQPVAEALEIVDQYLREKDILPYDDPEKDTWPVSLLLDWLKDSWRNSVRIGCMEHPYTQLPPQVMKLIRPLPSEHRQSSVPSLDVLKLPIKISISLLLVYVWREETNALSAVIHSDAHSHLNVTHNTPAK
mmetsp:Transcript_17774/g.26257  ORF Transcript_17774/g.26257 Transcript_17774/m.26257 type:complete len:152 (+) Transcript_17774:268-723(+)